MFGWIMPAPLAMPVTVTVPAADLDAARERGLRHGVGRHDRLGGVEPSSSRASAASARGSAGHDALDRQRLHDDAGRERQHLAGVAPERARDRVADARARAQGRPRRFRQLALPVLTTSARIAPPRGEMLAAHTMHRRGAEAVLGEHAGDAARRGERA